MDPYEEEARDPRRVELIASIAALIPEDVEPGFWAFLWLSDVEKLQAFADDFDQSRAILRRAMYENIMWTRALKTWVSRDHKSSINLPRAEIWEDFADAMTSLTMQKCRQRDKNTCLITRKGNCTEVAHIYPYYLGTKTGQEMHREFWETLSTFWSEDQIKQWESGILGPQQTEVLHNLISLSPTVHALWDKARFALKPLEMSPDLKTLTVEFHWLHHFAYEFKDPQTPPSLCSNDTNDDGTVLFDCKTKRCIQSGDTITLTTDDPKTIPLPSMELLHMQWVLNRLVALSGAADISDQELDNVKWWPFSTTSERGDEISLEDEEEEDDAKTVIYCGSESVED